MSCNFLYQETKDTVTTTSAIYNALPIIVQSRVPKLRSLRQSISGLRSRTPHSLQSDTACGYTTASSTRCSSRSGSNSRPMSAYSAADSETLRDDPLSFDYTISSSSTFADHVAAENNRSIDWKYAFQGRGSCKPTINTLLIS
jgi:hypothetical protein